MTEQVRLMRRPVQAGSVCRRHGPKCLDPLGHVIGGTRAHDKRAWRREAGL